MDDLEAAIRSAYGVELDPAFIEMIRFVVNGAPSSGYELPLSFDHFSGPVSDVLTPKQKSAYFFPGAPEFFAFASNGGGGELGFLGHAPELRSAVPRQGAARSECPLILFDLHLTPATRMVGTTFREGIARLVADETSPHYESHGEEDSEAKRRSSLAALAKRLELDLLLAPRPPLRSFVPTIPRGWRYVPTGDGVGVLAPNAQFDSVGPASDPFAVAIYPHEDASVRDALTRSRDARARNKAATALGIMREMIVGWVNTRLGQEIEREMASAYRALGRASLARRLEARW